ncbi:MAG: DUF2585 family protein [Planctomycetaceae bacterium]|nr:DUF2585 family protein [Planctomycetaceae bacterium]
MPTVNRDNRLISRRWTWFAAILTVLTAQVGVLRLEGRDWWCECGRWFLWTSDAWGSHTSQHFADPYSLTHALHGFIFCWVLAWLWPRLSLWRMTFYAMAIEAVWEVIENSQFVIDRYRDATAALGYVGDTIGNSLGDSLFCLAGFLLAYRIGWRWSAAIFVAVEAILLVTIRDSLLLNVVMLLAPLDVIRDWQMGHG